MSKIVCGEYEIPCPYCTDGFTTTGDRHARTRQDVCGHCGGTGKAPAGTGKTAATSAPPLLSTEAMVATARIDRIERQMLEHGGVDSDDLEWMAQGVRQAIAAGCARPAPIPHPDLMSFSNDGVFPTTHEVGLTMALATLTDAFLSRHGCFPLDRTTKAEVLWNDAMVEAYRLVGQPGTQQRGEAMARVGGEIPPNTVLPGGRFSAGDKVIKNRGDYWWTGHVMVGFNLPDNGPVRYVVAHKVDYGYVLHIYSDAQLELAVDDE